MTTFPGSPRLIRGGLVNVHPASGEVLRVIPLQYNPDSVTRTLQVQGVGAESGDRLEALRLRAPAIETIKIEAEIDASDQLEAPRKHPVVVEFGLFPQLAAIESLVSPTADALRNLESLAQRGVLEVAPAEAPLTLFVWSKNRIVPVRVTELSVTEEAFDPSLNPIRAKVSLGLRVLTVNDLGFSRGGNLFMAYLRQKEQLGRRNPSGSTGTLGIGDRP